MNRRTINGIIFSVLVSFPLLACTNDVNVNLKAKFKKEQITEQNKLPELKKEDRGGWVSGCIDYLALCGTFCILIGTDWLIKPKVETFLKNLFKKPLPRNKTKIIN